MTKALASATVETEAGNAPHGAAASRRETSTGDRSGRWAGALRRPWVVPAGVAGLASVLFVLGFGGGPQRMKVPLGGGDLLPAYATAQMWAEGRPFGSTALGWPFGLELRYYPTADVLPNLVAGLVTWVTGNPFFGIHTVYALSFPATALAALWVFRVAGLRGPWTVVGSLALTFLPYHWYRLEHLFLATMYSAVLGVGLALLVGNGTVERRLRSPGRWRFVLLLVALAVVIGGSGVYYAAFTVLLCAAAGVWRLTRGVGWRDLLVAAVPPVLVTVVLAVVLLPSVLYSAGQPPLQPVAERSLIDTTVYSGALVFAMLPAPFSRLPGMGVVNDWVNGTHESLGADGFEFNEMHGASNFGSLATVVALLVCAIGGLVLARRAARAGAEGRRTAPSGRGELGLVLFLLAVAVLFFVPWGPNFLFAYAVSPDVRAWNRLIPVLFVLLLVAAGLVLRRLAPTLRPRLAAGLLALAMVVVVFDSVLPARSFFGEAAAAGAPLSGTGYTYAAALNEAVPGECGVLQLPYVEFPEVPPKQGLGNYDLLWPAITNPDKSWSFGAMKNTAASAWTAAVGDDIDAADVGPLVAGGFCAVHVDLAGYTGDDGEALTYELDRLLGAPVATGADGQWLAYELPGHGEGVLDAEELVDAPGSIGTFYSPPTITAGEGAPTWPKVDVFHSTYSLTEQRAEFLVESLDGGAEFRSLTGELRSGECGDHRVELALVADGAEVSTTVELDAGEVKAFDLALDDPTRAARLVVRTSGPVCEGTPDQDPESVAVIDLRAQG
ncbi:hypothetical protein [Blastococcus sp. CCUG 61487]|uniref:hypothetical protein n=1 Tax=Blastococcus sp. CCUG 61487 TaxID=1840703 RepID=UPI0010C0A7EF|nr:hypothetical protein [Blastococcus sp. CCUG 61487]TKJ35635.1 hypothetical protein A6V29_14070 [Blastococcus sp. CCUG 61487]